MSNVEVISDALDQNELIKYLNRASLVVLPFRFWPQVECPLTILEAMSMEKTVVTTNVGAIPEIIDNWNNGIMVPPRDSMQLAKVVTRLMENRALSHRIGIQARAHVERFYDWNKIVNATLTVLENYAR
jgi:glycosyltransferase involved in cell wall biosynthesis